MPQIAKTYSCYFDSPAGRLLLAASDDGIIRIAFHSQLTGQDIDCPEASQKHLVQLKSELKEYFEGKRNSFDVPLVLHGSEFRKKVWKAVSEIPYGKTVSYLELSKTLGQPEAIRAVANANAHNPLLIVIPCHRVIGSNGELTGYAGGLPQKRFLLELEGSLHRNQTVLEL